MNNWRIVGKIATGFGIVCVAFAVYAAAITYGGMNLNPGYYSVQTIQLSILSSMLQYLFFAALSFVAAVFSMRAGKENTEVKTPLPEAQSTETSLPEAESNETQA
jgi:nicotinamide riboside transporter PnuC